MPGVHQDTTAQAGDHISTPAALWLLASLAGFHRQPFDAELVIRRFPPPFDLPTLIEALAALGLKAGLAAWPSEGQPALPLPAVALLAAPDASTPAAHTAPTLTPALIVRHGEDTLAWVKPGQAAPETLKLDAARAQATPALLLVTPAEPPASETAGHHGEPETQATRKPFGFSWFVPELLRHQRIWRDVLLASLSIQLVGLATPLFTQVIIDKVIAHRSESTLIVLGVALVVFMLFTSGMTWLRQYLVLHTGSRIDAVLGEKVLKHLLHLPLPYFEARPTGTLVARLHGVEQLREFISGAAVSLVLDLPFLLIFLAVMFSYSWPLTLIAVGIMALIVTASLFMVPVFRERLDKQFLLGARNQAFLTEYLAGMATVKSLQLEPDVAKRYGTYLAQYLSAGFATKQVGNTYNVVANGLEQVMTLSILIVGAWLVMQPDAGMTVGMLVAFQMFASRMSQPLLRLVGLWQEFQQASISVKRLGDILDMPQEPFTLTPQRAAGGEGHIDIRDLGFLAVMLVALLIALLCGAALAWAISRSILRQLGAEPSELGDVAQRVASGNLSAVQGAASAPTGSVLASLGAMQNSLASVVGQVRQASDSIATGSAEIATGNADLSHRTEEQASHLQQTATSMAQMNAMVQTNADTARQATQLATSASAAAQKGGDVVSQVVTTMDDIAQSSRKINDIIGVIDGIAFQTNILALNAAVEAARAGEQGRGFAVVAGEVRNLAQRSAEAAKEIKGLIGTSVDKVEAGTRLVSDAGSTMEDIVTQVRRVSDLISEISASTHEQTTGIGQVSESVTQLDQSTQQNAALVEQSAAASASLQQQAAKLTDVVRTFRLD